MDSYPAGTNAGGGFGGLGTFLMDTANGPGVVADRTYGVGFETGGGVEVSRQNARVTGSVSVSGIATLVVGVLALLALDRYVLDVPGIGK